MQLPYPHPSVRAGAQSPRAVAGGFCHRKTSGELGWGSTATLGRDAQHPDRDITQGLCMRDRQELPHTELKPAGKGTNRGKHREKVQNKLLPDLNKLSSSGGRQEGQIPAL